VRADDDAFRSAIAANRFDVGLRQVYADWLDENDRPEEAAYQRRWTPEVGAAEDWLHEFAEKSGLGYEEAVRAGTRYVETGVEWGVGTNWEPETLLETDDALAAFWRSVELVTGRPAGDEMTKATVPFQCCRWEHESGDPDQSTGWM
jgi:uncharacterized protein (TIGR02996 family)